MRQNHIILPYINKCSFQIRKYHYENYIRPLSKPCIIPSKDQETSCLSAYLILMSPNILSARSLFHVYKKNIFINSQTLPKFKTFFFDGLHSLTLRSTKSTLPASEKEA
ncbi:hypothetical protein YC2023_008059 [Brassica napus]